MASLHFCPTAAVSAMADKVRALASFFPRSYRFGPRATVACIMALTARCLVDSYEEALDFVHRHLGASMGWDNAPAKSGLTRARRALGVEPMRAFWREQLADAQAVVRPIHHGLPEDRRVLAIDGSWMLMPDSEGVRQRWSQAGRSCDTVPQALLVAAIEITQRLPVAATVVGLDVGERAAATSLLTDLKPSDILLFDRGYPGREFLAAVNSAGFDLAVRMVVGAGGFPEVDAFWKTGEDDAVVTIDLPGRGPMPVRLIRRRFPRGRPHASEGREKMVILTTLMDRDRYPAETILALYRARWEAETFFREVKTAMQIEAFHSTSPDGILQEMYATLAWMALFAFTEAQADTLLVEARGVQRWDDPCRYTINRAQLGRLIRRNVNDMFSPDPMARQRATDSLIEGITLLAQRSTRRRPDRHFERRRKSPWGRFRNEPEKKR